MIHLHDKYYYAQKDIPKKAAALRAGYSMVSSHPLFGKLNGEIFTKTSHLDQKGSIACVAKNGDIHVNDNLLLTEKEWAYAIAHCLLHLAFGHFDEKMLPQDEIYIPAVWNKACDIYITRFLADIRFADPLFADPANAYPISLNDEAKIYSYLLKNEGENPKQDYGLNTARSLDMTGLDHPVNYKGENPYAKCFADAITNSVKSAVSTAGGHSLEEGNDTPVKKAAAWFLSHYPLLGGLAASFHILEDPVLCQKYEIQIAAVDTTKGIIYANPACGFSEEEWRFVLAHEFLHAGLCHQKRCMGRDFYLWNIACDYVVNDWLSEMEIGVMPKQGLLYDETLHGMSAEAIYDQIIKEMRKYKKLMTFRGYGAGDLFGDNSPHFTDLSHGITLDEFFKNSLREGLDYHITSERGYLPLGLVEEIKALSSPPIPWEVQLAEWFDERFPPLEKYRSYARASRRQGATPDIPRPGYVINEKDRISRTFGVVIDTSGSMSNRKIGLALGAAASYARAKDVFFIRIIFCDAKATDAGYLSPDELMGRVKVTGRGGTILQPGVDTLEKAEDFPVNGPILIVTDGMIEPDLKIKRDHAFLIPKGSRLPFTPKGKVFYFHE